MFGYIKPQKGMLRVFEWEQYRAVYCGLCHALGEEFGFCARFLVNYDFTFLALILMRAGGERAQIARRRCVAQPFCKRCAMTTSPALRAAAAATVILSHWQLCDAVEDKSFWRGIPARAARAMTRRAYRRARRKLPEFDRLVRGCLDELHALERAGSDSLDRTADAFARILRAAAPEGEDEGRNRALGQLLYHVGRWIYLLDAWDDREKDEKNGDYNPVNRRFPVCGAAEREYLRTTLRHSRNLAGSALALLEQGRWTPILENIVYLGMPAAEEMVFAGTWRGGKRQRRRGLVR